jgi:hypothetical protein
LVFTAAATVTMFTAIGTVIYTTGAVMAHRRWVIMGTGAITPSWFGREVPNRSEATVIRPLHGIEVVVVVLVLR